MGNNAAALARVTSIESKDMLSLRELWSGKDFVTREEFDKAVAQSDVEIFDRLFVLLDRCGENRINAREFCVMLSVLADNLSHREMLSLAFDLYGASEDLKPAETLFVLSAINDVVAWLGDPVVATEQIQTLVQDVFGERQRLSSVIDPVLQHDVARLFIAGKGTVRQHP